MFLSSAFALTHLAVELAGSEQRIISVLLGCLKCNHNHYLYMLQFCGINDQHNHTDGLLDLIFLGFTAAYCTYTVQDQDDNAVIGLYVAHKYQVRVGMI